MLYATLSSGTDPKPQNLDSRRLQRRVLSTDVSVVIRGFECLAQLLQWLFDARQGFVERNLSELVPPRSFVRPPLVIEEQVAPTDAVLVLVDSNSNDP